MVWSLAFAWAGGIHLSGRVVLVLALATWCAYVADRLLDARVLGAQAGVELSTRPDLGRPESGQPELRERHYFHWRNRRLFVPVVAIAACVAAIMAVGFLPVVIGEGGFVLAAAALAYFSGVHAAPRLERWRHSLPRFVTKELLVAVLFTAGCILPAWSKLHASGLHASIHALWTTDSTLWQFWIPGVYFAALAWLNCSSIATWEAEKKSGSSGTRDSRALFWGVFPALTTNLSAAAVLAFTGFLLACLASRSDLRVAALLMAGATSAVLLALLDRLRKRMTPLALRAAADFVLLTPVLVFLR
jgi:hypothetical protein